MLCSTSIIYPHLQDHDFSYHQKIVFSLKYRLSSNFCPRAISQKLIPYLEDLPSREWVFKSSSPNNTSKSSLPLSLPSSPLHHFLCLECVGAFVLLCALSVLLFIPNLFSPSTQSQNYLIKFQSAFFSAFRYAEILRSLPTRLWRERERDNWAIY